MLKIVTNVTGNEPTSDIEHANEFSLNNYPLPTAQPPPSQNVYKLNQGASSTASASNTLVKSSIKYEVLWAEIISTIYKVVNHNSFNSSKHSSNLYEIMFPDSNIAKQFSCGPSKMAYMAAFGLGPYFSDLLVSELSDIPYYSISFDESYNTVAKKEQLDVLFRYYDVKTTV